MRVLRFRIGDRWLAVDLTWVREVCPPARLRAVPGAPRWMPGLLDLHGTLVPTVDGGVLLGDAPVPVRVGARIIVLEGPLQGRPDAAQARFGLLASAVEGVSEVDRGGGWSAHGGLPGLGFLTEVIRSETGETLLLDAGLLAGEHAALLAGEPALSLPGPGGDAT